MDYSEVLVSVRNTSKDDLKKLSFEIDSEHIKKIKDMELDETTKDTLIKMSKDRAFLTMLLINALK